MRGSTLASHSGINRIESLRSNLQWVVPLTLFYALFGVLCSLAPPKYLVGAVALPLVLFLSLLDLKIGLAVFPFVVALSPEFDYGSVTLRLEDFLLPILLLVWIMRQVFLKEKFVSSGISVPLLVYFLVVTLATAFGVSLGKVEILDTLFRLVKYVQYLLLFYLVMSTLRSRKEVTTFAWLLLAAGGVAGVYGSLQHHLSSTGVVTGPPGEDYNIFAGYLLIHLIMAISLLVSEIPFSQKVVILILAAPVAYALPYTFSRTSYVAILAGLIFLGLHRYRPLLGVSLLLILSYQFLFPSDVVERISSIWQIFAGESAPSAFLARIETWKWYVPNIFFTYPFLGLGLGSATLSIDSEYLRTILESGIFGLCAFVWLIITLFRIGREVERQEEDPFCNALAMGFLAVVVSLSVHAIGATSFSTIRTMEAFWFLTGLVLVLYNSKKGEQMLECRRLSVQGGSHV